MNISSYRARREGGGLIETLIALMIVAITLASTSPLITQAYYGVRLGRDHYVATTIALATLEQGRNLNLGLLPLLAASQYVVDDQGLPSAAGRFRRSVVVEPNVPTSGVTQVTVTVEILDRRRGGFRGSNQTMKMAYTSYEIL
jgi:type II secretory pathway pseudopilin PulG